MENHVERLPALAERLRTEITGAERELEQAMAAQAKPFKHGDDLATARAELQRIETILNPPEEPAVAEQAATAVSIKERAAALRDEAASGCVTRTAAGDDRRVRVGIQR